MEIHVWQIVFNNWLTGIKKVYVKIRINFALLGEIIVIDVQVSVPNWKSICFTLCSWKRSSLRFQELEFCLISSSRGKDSSAKISFSFSRLLQIQILRIPYEGKKRRGSKNEFSHHHGFSVNTRAFARGNAALTVRVPRMEQIYRSVESLWMPRCFAIGPVISYLFPRVRKKPNTVIES